MSSPLPTIPGGFKVILADPPWNFKSNSLANPGRNARRHYACMSLADIAALPVADITAQDAVLFMWITSPFLVLGAHLPIMKAWGFKPSAVGFVWAKTNKSAHGKFLTRDDFFMGGGFTTRSNTELCLIGSKGRSLRKSASVRELIVAPVSRHSEKPLEAMARIEAYADGPRLEMFSRKSRPGWIAWGKETGKYD